MTAEQVLDLCKSKDSSEKLFRGDKSCAAFKKGRRTLQEGLDYIKGKADI